MAMSATACLSAAASAQAAAIARGTVRVDTLWTQSLGVRKRLVVWLPPSYDADAARRYPVAIYLHGLWGNEHDWTQQGKLAETLDSLAARGVAPFIVAMPDGDDGWYTTWNSLGDYAACRRTFAPKPGDTVESYCVPWPHYDDYIARDVVQFLDKKYRTKASRTHRAIAGLSMGGYGAVSLALAYPEVFSVAVSHSGVLSPLYSGGERFSPPARYATSAKELQAGWGERFWPLLSPAFGQDLPAWLSRDPARRARSLSSTNPTKVPAIMFDVGTSDGLLGQNRAFRWEMAQLGVPVKYVEWPGAHDWAYWSHHAPDGLRFIAERIAK